MFEGFSPEAFDFLWGIRFNNNKTWFEENKKTYTDRLYQPMKQLAAEVFEPFRDMPGMLCKVSRIYRDARLPGYAERPYKDSLWLCIRRECLSWSEHPALALSVPAALLPGWFFAAGSGVCCGLVPLGILLVGARKKVAEKE